MTQDIENSRQNKAIPPDVEIFLFIDALGWDTVSRTNYLSDLFPHRRNADMQFGYSCTAIPTILSGCKPSVHGHLGLFRFAPQSSPFRLFSKFSFLFKPESLWNRGRVRNILSRIVKKLYGYTGYFQLYQVPISKLGLMDYCEKKNLFIEHGLENVANLYDLLSSLGIKFHISDWHLHDAQNLEKGCEAIENGTQFLFLYTAEFDSLMHSHVNDYEVIQQKLDWYSQRIRPVFDCCKKLGKSLRFTIISDHGMTPLTYTVDVMSRIEATGLKHGKDYGACYDSTMVRFTYLSQNSREEIHKIMDEFCSSGHWLSKDEEQNYGIYREDRIFGDEIFFMNPGVQVVPSDMGNKPLNGMHGFAPEDEHSQATIMSTDPIPDYVRSVSDYFNLMKERAVAIRDAAK